jgi:hypothetical protein
VFFLVLLKLALFLKLQLKMCGRSLLNFDLIVILKVILILRGLKENIGSL